MTTFAALAAQYLGQQSPPLAPDVAQGITNFAAWLDQSWQPQPIGEPDVPLPLFS